MIHATLIRSDTQGRAKNADGKGIGVGAAIIFSNIDYVTEAYIGKRVTAEAGSADIIADHTEKRLNAAVAGTDPMNTPAGMSNAGRTPTVNNVSVDAAVIIVFDEADVSAGVNDGAKITTKDSGNLTIHGTSTTDTKSEASGYAAGDQTAVGATVVVNFAESEIKAFMDGTANIGGNLDLKGYTYDQDIANAVATAIGADIARYLGKFNQGTSDLTTRVNDFLSGKKSTEKKTNLKNETATQINNKIGSRASEGAQTNENGSTTSNGQSTSSNVLNTRNVTTDGSGNETVRNSTNEASDTVRNNTDENQASAPTTQEKEKTKVMAAAAISWNMVEHNITVRMQGNVEKAAKVDINAENKSDFRAYATAAAVSLSKVDYMVAAGVALMDNDNDTHIIIGRDGEDAPHSKINASGDITIESKLTENMDGKFKGWLGAQALAGSISKEAKLSVSGAVAYLGSEANTDILIHEGAEIKSSGADSKIKINAQDKSKLAIRAGNAQGSKGNKNAVGVSIAIIWADNNVIVQTMPNVVIEAGTVDVTATKLKVDKDDFTNQVSWSNLVTKDNKDGKTGLIDIKSKNKDGNNSNNKTTYSVSTSLSTNRLLELVDVLNFLTSNNYYAEAISGAIAIGDEGNFLGVGSVAMVFEDTNTYVEIGNENTIKSTKGDISLKAKADTTARTIAGAVAAGKSATAAGAGISVVSTDNVVRVNLGTKDNIESAAAYTQSAESIDDSLVITAEAAVNAKDSGRSYGASVSIVLNGNLVESNVGAQSKITAAKDINVSTKADHDLCNIAVGVQGGKGAALGGTILFQKTTGQTYTYVGDQAVLTSTSGNINLTADTVEKMVAVLASASVSKDVGAVAATVFVPIAKSVASVTTDDVTLNAKDIVLDANADTKVIGVNFNATVAGGTNGFGLSVAIAVFKHYVQAGIGQGSVVNASGNVAVRANAEELTVIVLGSAGYAKEAGVNGQIAVVVSDNLSKAIIGMYAPKLISTDEEANAVQVTKVTAGGSVYVNADLTTKDYLIVGGFTVASQDFAAGFTIAALKESNAADALINRLAKITASVAANVDGWTDRKKKKHGKGLEINANHESSSILIAIPVAVGQGTSVAFALPIKIQKNRITSKVRSGAEVTVKKSAGTRQAVLLNALKADGSDDGKESDSEEGPAVTITATKNTFVFVLGGALSMSSSENAIAPAVGVLTYKDTMEVTNESKLTTDFGVKIKADRDDDVDLFVVGIAGGSQMAIAGDISVLTFNNTTKVVVAKEIDAGGDVEIAAHSDVQTINAVGSVGVSMSSFAVAGALLVTYFKNVTTVDVNKMIKILTPGKVTIKADSDEDVYSFVINLAVSNGAGVALAAAVVYSEVETRATMGTSAQVGKSAASPVESFLLHAKDNYTNVTVSANAGVSTGGLAVAISGLVSTSYNTVTAKMDSKAKVYASGDAVVEALADRSINAFSATVSVAGATVGAAVNANIVIAGAAMNDDAHKVVALDGGSNDTTPIQTFIDNAFSDKNTKAYIESEKPDTDLSETYKSDGTSAGSDMNLGKNDKGEYDGSNYSKDLAAKEGETESKNRSSEEAAKNIDSNVETLTGNVGEESSQALNRDDRVLKDAVTSTVNTKAEIHAGKDIKVLAAEQVAMRVISGTVGVGGTSGAAVGVTVAILYSNVEAVVNAAAVLDAGGNVIVHAESTTANRNLEKLGLSYDGKDYKSGDVDKKAEKDTEEKKGDDKATGDKESNEKIKAENNIFIISVNAGIGGVGGLAVSLSWLSVQSNVMAKVLGKVTAENLEVTTNLDYSKICNVNLGISVAGVGSAAAAITVTKFNGTHEAAIGGGAVITTSGTTKVSNNVNANLVAVTVVAAIAGQGAIAFNVTVGINRVRADAYVGEGVTLKAGKLDISNIVHAANNVVTVNVAISGGGAGGVTVNVLINKPTALAYTGRTPVDEEGASDEKTADLNKIGLENKEDNIKAHSKSAVAGSLTIGSDTAAGEVNVSSSVTGKIHAVGVSVTAGLYGGFTGAVTVAKQASVNAAVVGGMPIKGAVAEHRPKMNVNAAIDGNVDTTSVAVTVGLAVAVGVQVTVASNTSHNTARIDLRGQTASVDEMKVKAGAKNEKGKVKSSNVEATVGSGAAGIGVVSFNFAQGSNTSVNNAEILGNADTELTANKVEVYALGASKAKTDIYNVSIGLFSISANIALSNQEAVQNARIYGIGSLQAESVKVTSEFNYNEPEKGKAEVIEDSAYSLTCNPVAFGAVTIAGSLSKANSDASTRAYMKGCGGTVTNSTTVETTARSKATADIDTPVVTVSLGDIGVAVVNAHADGTAESFVDTTGAAETPSLGALTVTTDAIAKADSKTAPGAPFSLKVTLTSYSENMAMASASLKAASYVKGAFNAGDTTVTSKANAETDATVKEAKLQVSLKNMAANQAEAKDLTENRAYIELTPGQKSTVNGKLKVTANTEGDAYAITGPGSGETNFTLTMKSGTVNVSFACSETINLADIRTANGAEGSEGELEVTGDLELTANNKPSKAKAEANTGGSVSLVNSCGVYAESFVSDRNKAAIGDYTKVTLTGNSANAKLTGNSDATSTASSYSGGGASLKNGTKGSMAAFIGNRLESKPLATDREEAQSVEVGIGNGSTLTAPGVITLQANNKGSANSKISGGLQGSAVASKDNAVPTYASFSTKVYTGEGATVDGEKVTMTADGKHTGRATMEEKSIALGSGKGKSFTANFADIDTAVMVSDNSSISAKSGIEATADFLVDVEAKASFWETSLYKGSDYNAWNKVNKNNAVQIGKEAKLTSDTGTIKLMAGNKHNDHVRAESTGKGIQGVSNADFISRNYYAPESSVQTGQDAEIKVKGSGTIQLVASNGNADDEKADGREQVELEAYVKADIGSFWNATNSNTENTYKPKAEVRTYQTTIDATGDGAEGNVDIRATVGKQEIYSYARIESDIVTDLDTFNRSYIDTFSNVLLDSSKITGKTDILTATVNNKFGREKNNITSYTYVNGGCGAVAGKMYAGGTDQINVKTDGTTFSNLNSNNKLYLSKKNNGKKVDYEEEMGARTNWLTRDKTDDDIKFTTKSEYYDRIRKEDGTYTTKTSYSAKSGEVNLDDLFGDALKNATIKDFADKPYEKNDDLMGEMDMFMDKSALTNIISTVTNRSENFCIVFFMNKNVVGIMRYKETQTKDGQTVQEVIQEIKDPAGIASYIKKDFEHKTNSAIRKKYPMDNYQEADQYLAKLTFSDGVNRVYNELQKLLPTNMSVTDWLKTLYGVAVYNEKTHTIIRKKTDDSHLAQNAVESVTFYDNGTEERRDTSSIWDALLQDTEDENGKTVSLIRKVARSKKEAEGLIDNTANGDQTAKEDLDKKVKQKKKSDGTNYKDVDEWLEDQYQGGDAQQDGKTWNGEDSGKGSDSYMWIWLLGIGLCLAAEYAVWKKRKEN